MSPPPLTAQGRRMPVMRSLPRSRHRWLRTPPGLCAVLAVVFLGCASPSVETEDSAPGDPPSGTKAAEEAREKESEAAAAIRSELQQICRDLRASDQRFYGEKPLADLKARLAEGVEGEQEVVARTLLGRELLEWGRPTEGIPELEKALQLARQQKIEGTFPLEILGTLALSHLQAAEDANCLAHHTAASCLLPVQPEGIHPLPEHARKAGDLYQEFLQQVPRSAVAAWLLNLSRMVTGDFPEGVPEPARLPPRALAEEAPFPRWRDRGAELGVNVVDLAGGAVMDDFDGDGRLDLVTSTADPCDSLKAFRNDGRGGFEDVTKAWGLDAQLGGLNLIHGDSDGDGRLDLLVLRGAWMFEHGRIRNSLLRNDLEGSGRFVDVTREAGLAEPAWPTQAAAWADYDGDGDLDLYVGNEAQPPDHAASQLFRNEGNGTFRDVAEEAGVSNRRFAKGVAWGDFDDDGDEDLYVSNIGPNRLYENQGDGTFTDVAPKLGVTAPERRSFATWFFDFDNDGDLDLFVADYNGPLERIVAPYFGTEPGSGPDGGQPLLYRNEGGTFTEVSRQVGLDRPTLPMGANYGDLDNDGWPDLYLGTGDPELESLIPNLMYRNAKGRFEDVTAAGGFGHLQKGHGVAFGDLDGDGDQDLFHQIGGFFPGDAYGNALFENPGPPAGKTAHWITLRLEGLGPGKGANRFALGARLRIRVRTPAGPREIHALAGSGGSFGGSSLQQEIGLGDALAVEEVEVRWPGSSPQAFTGLEMDRVYLLVEGETRPSPVP